ncbi:MAG: nucleotidyltransferase domain-containing protein [Deltaproteobacteria bacterium]|nr:nucleotidyltransferase domain-containing protein [Deltaproteobacteria bacterium]
MASVSSEIEGIIHKFIALLQKERRVLKVVLYGSHAKGIAGTWSDIDLAVVSPDFSEDLFEERIRLMKLALNVSRKDAKSQRSELATDPHRQTQTNGRKKGQKAQK